MNKKQLGNSDLNISRIGFGAWAIGGAWEYGWGPQEDKDSIRTIHKALDSGINWIDTAPIYGLGHSEEVIGQALKETSNKPYVFTKCSLVWDDKRNISNVLKRESVIREAEASLKRLGVETIDMYQIHWPNPDEDLEEAFEAMVQLKKQGKVRHLGVSNFSIEQMDRVRSIADVVSDQPKYNAITREVEAEILPYCSENNIGTIVYSPMGSGLLTGKMTRERIAGFGDTDWRSRDDQFKEPLLTSNLEVVKRLERLALEKGCSVAEVALSWVISNDKITGAITGMRSERQVDGIIGADQVMLSDEERRFIVG